MALYEPLSIDGRVISDRNPMFFIADIASNHDGELERAIELIWKAADAGAEAVKFQHFLADEIASDVGFRLACKQGTQGHQKDWPQSVFETFKKYELDRAWTPKLAEEAEKAGVAFLSTPYDLEAVELLDPCVSAFKIGSGDFGWRPLLNAILKKRKPVILATGATTLSEIRSVMTPLSGMPVSLMQCNTNYSGDFENFRHINLKVISRFREEYPGMTVGLSDHTPEHATVLGAVALGARLVEKHFTDDNRRTGPDHAFSMTPATWREMLERTRELEAALGDGLKKVEANEAETRILQRRGLYLTRDVEAGDSITRADLKALRPCLPEALSATSGRLYFTMKTAKKKGEPLFEADVL